jgi:hypothetical protein
VNEPFTAFQQVIRSSTNALTVRTNEDFTLPVQIENPGSDTWVSVGRMPVTISYKWFSGNTVMPIEGERTQLPAPIPAKGSADVKVKVIAPGQPGKYELRMSLVQEGVAWFMTKSNTYLSVPVTVQ